MSLISSSTQSQAALTPYAVTRRRELKDERRREREQRKQSPVRLVQGIWRGVSKKGEVEHLDQAEADDALMKVEAGLKTDPGTARESQVPNPKIVRATLRS